MRSAHLARSHVTQFVLLALVCLVAFAVYANCVRLMPLHDDSHIIARIRSMTLLDIFNPASSGGIEYRPTGTLFWILTRDLFGWFVPGILHMWNVFFHVLNTALVAMLVQRLTQPHPLLPFAIALLFALFPQSYQAVIAGAIYHPAMLLMGLLAMHAYLTYRRTQMPGMFLLCAIALAATCLSHEAGFVFGPLIALIEMTVSTTRRERFRKVVFALAAAALLYPIAYRVLITSMWTPERGMLTTGIVGLLDKFLYYEQGLLWWVIALMRPVFGNFELNTSSRLLLLIGLLAATGLGLWLTWRSRRVTLALFGLAWWLIALAPSIIALPFNYVTDTPRLMYVPSVGIAIFWGAALIAFVERMQQRLVRLAPLAMAGLMMMWSVTYIDARLTEVARLAPAFNLIERTFRNSPPEATVLLINPPFLLLPAQPSFLFGREGFSVWEPNPGYGPIGNWTATIGGTYRAGQAVRHIASLTARNPNSGEADKSFTLGQRFNYGVFAPAVDDTGLRQAMLTADFSFRFDYDAPGLRLRHASRILRERGAREIQTFASFSRAAAQIKLLNAFAVHCNQRILVQLTWHNAGEAFDPTGIFVHGYDGANNQLLTADKDLLDGILPINELPHDTVVTETREIGDATSSVQIQSVRVGLYSRADVVRFTATRADGSPWEVDAVVVPLITDSVTTRTLCAE